MAPFALPPDKGQGGLARAPCSGAPGCTLCEKLFEMFKKWPIEKKNVPQIQSYHPHFSHRKKTPFHKNKTYLGILYQHEMYEIIITTL